MVGNQLSHSPSEVTLATERVSFEAQREFPRWPVSTGKPVRVDLGPAGSGQLIDVSMGGARVKSVAPLRRDTELPLRIDVPERLEPLRCLARVVWSKPNGAAGLRFTNLPDDQKAVLSGWIHELQDAATGDKGHRDDEFTRISAQVKNMKLNNADALSLIARRAVQIAGASSVVIALGKAEQMICLARAGVAPELGSLIPPQGLTGECARSRKVVHCLDASTDPRAFDLKQGSALIVPLLVNGELRGVMQVFAQRPGIFNAQRTESIEQLADAVVYVTHNALPRTRPSETGSLATVTTMPKRSTASAPAITSPSDSGRMAAYSAPVASKPSDSGRIAALGSAPAVTKPSDSGRMAAFVSPAPTPVSAPYPAMPEPAFVAPETALPITPLAAPLQPSAPAQPIVPPPIARPLAVEQRRVQPRIAPAVKSAYVPVPPRSSSSRWLFVAIAAVLAIFAAAFTIRWARQKPAPPIAATAPAPAKQVVANEQAASPEQNPAAVAPAEVPATPVAKPAALKEEQVAQRPERVEKKAVVIEKAPEPAPIMLAAAAPVHETRQVEPDTPAPSAQIATTAMPRINLPGQVAAPKLAAPPPKVITGGTLLVHPSPTYPEFAIRQRIEGTVKLEVTITAMGTVTNIRSISGPAILIGAASSAVKRWRYDPPKINGQPVTREATITLDFKLPSQGN